jgi:hypothetical protein
VRLPLIRFGNDETPIAWWEWLFVPLMVPLFFVGLLCMSVVSVPVELAYRIMQWQGEKRLRPRLTGAGRFLEWPAVEAKLMAGEGTLIVEHLSPKGPIREWWSKDDLIAAAPVPLPASLRSLPVEGQVQPLQEFAAVCAARYTDTNSGEAKLTEVPISLARRLDPAKYKVVDLGEGLITAILLRTGRKLAEKYPSGKVVTLIAWLGEPLLFVGDAERVFLTDAEPLSWPTDLNKNDDSATAEPLSWPTDLNKNDDSATA